MKKDMGNDSPFLSFQESLEQAQRLLEQLTLEEKISLTGGTRGFFIKAVERLGIKEVFMADASCGVNIRETWLEDRVDTDLEKSTAFPCSLLLAATWNPELSEYYARSIGEECRAAGISILLGPGMNIYRHSQAGRNFEYLGEDPFLVSRMVESYVKGLQSTGVAATLKHFIANNSDFFRRRSNSILQERALREIYMPGFRAGIEAGARGVMTAYNLLNGEWCSQSRQLITEILREELGFQWLVMTDWWAIYDGEKTLKSGQDLEMPAREVLASLEELLEQGRGEESQLDSMVLSILTTSLSLRAYADDYQKKEYLQNYSDHEKTALQTAREGVVLLKNQDDLLPLDGSQTVLLTGRFALERARGGGAAEVEGYHVLSLKEALEKELPGKVLYRSDPTDEELRQAERVILATGTLDSEGWDRPFSLPEEEEEKICRTLQLNPKTAVVVLSGGGVRMTRWADKAGAILYGWYGGQTGARALAEILCGACNPSGKLPITIEREFEDSPGAGYLPEGESLYEGWNDQAEKKHAVFDVTYDEGILVGYRWYDTKGIAPLFPFGYGLSYTVFSFSNLSLSSDSISSGERISLTLDLKNTGHRQGMETVQVYVKAEESAVLRPEKELKGFLKVNLQPGETKRLSLTLEPEAFAYWDEESREWTVESGLYSILAGSSSRDLPLHKILQII